MGEEKTIHRRLPSENVRCAHGPCFLPSPSPSPSPFPHLFSLTPHPTPRSPLPSQISIHKIYPPSHQPPFLPRPIHPIPHLLPSQDRAKCLIIIPFRYFSGTRRNYFFLKIKRGKKPASPSFMISQIFLYSSFWFFIQTTPPPLPLIYFHFFAFIIKEKYIYESKATEKRRGKKHTRISQGNSLPWSIS